MMRHIGLLIGSGFVLFGTFTLILQVVLVFSPAARADTAAAASPATGPSTAGVPASCSPRPGLSTSSRTADATAAAALAHRSGYPLKDLAIQPALITVPQWTSLLNIAKKAGANVINVGVSWSAYEPNGPAPAHEWTSLKQFVHAVRARGMEVRFQLYGFPTWARDSGEPDASAEPWFAPEQADELARWSAFVTRVVDEFGTTVSYYEIWNEENIPQFWSQGPSAVAYSNLLECSYVAAKEANHGVTIVSGGLSTNDTGFLSQLYSALDRSPDARADNHFFDVLGVHPYSGGRSPEVDQAQYVVDDSIGSTENQNFLGFTSLHAIMAAHGDGRKKIYIGEYGWPVMGFPAGQDNGSAAVSETQRASWIPSAYRIAARSGDVIAMSVYTFYPSPYDSPAWALVRNPDGSTDATTQWAETPSFKAFASVP